MFLVVLAFFFPTVANAADSYFDEKYFDELAEGPAARMGKETGRRAFKRLHEPAAESGKTYGELAEERLKHRLRHVRKNLPHHRFFLVVSESVPSETLRAYAAQAEELAEKGTPVVFVLRGFVGGIKKFGPTVRFYMSFALRDPRKFPARENLRRVELSVDPLRTHGVSAVPALMDEKGCVVYGDAPLPYLIGKIEEKACGKTFGATYTMVERDALQEIREAVFRATSRLARARRRIAAELRDIRGVSLPSARKNKTFRVRRIFTLRQNIVVDGRVMARAGTYDLSSSPVSFSGIKIFVVNADEPKQISWLKRELPGEPGWTVLVGGNVRKVCRDIPGPCYPLTSELVRAFSLDATPAKISGSADGTFVVSEFFLP